MMAHVTQCKELGFAFQHKYFATDNLICGLGRAGADASATVRSIGLAPVVCNLKLAADARK